MKSIATIAAISAVLIALPITVSAQQSLTVASWGGALAKAQTETMYKPFEVKNNIKVISDHRGGGLGEIAAQVKSNNIKWDIVDITPNEAIKGCEEGLFEKIDIGKLPAGADGSIATKDFLPGAIYPCAVATNIFANVLAYDRAKLGNNGPKSLEDFFDTQKFPGKRGAYKSAIGITEWALMADGVAPGDVYKVMRTPTGIDRAFRKLDTIKKDIIWWSAGTQPVQMLVSGDVIMTYAWSGRIADANVKDKKDFAISWDGHTTMANMFAIVKGNNNLAASQEFIRVATSTQAAANLVTYLPYTPSRLSSMALIPNDAPNKSWLPGNQNPGRSLRIDPEFWVEYGDDLSKRFNGWLAK